MGAGGLKGPIEQRMAQFANPLDVDKAEKFLAPRAACFPSRAYDHARTAVLRAFAFVRGHLFLVELNSPGFFAL